MNRRDFLSRFPVSYRGWLINADVIEPPNMLAQLVIVVAHHEQARAVPGMRSRSLVPMDEPLGPKLDRNEANIRAMIDKWHETGELPPMETFSYGDE